MVRVKACFALANMVQNHADGDGSARKLVSQPMNGERTACMLEASIAFIRDIAHPEPAAGRSNRPL